MSISENAVNIFSQICIIIIIYQIIIEISFYKDSFKDSFNPDWHYTVADIFSSNNLHLTGCLTHMEASFKL